MALSEHSVGGEEGPGALTLEIVRLGLFYAVHEHPGWLSLTNRIFLEQLPLLADHPDWMDPHAQSRI